MTNKLQKICIFITDLEPNITRFRLQKLLYFIQASSIIYLGREAFTDNMYKFEYSVVIPELYDKEIKDNDRELEEDLIELIKVVVYSLKKYSSYELVDILLSYNVITNTKKGDIINIEDIYTYHKKLYTENNKFIF